jgi:xylulokinase
MSDVMGIDLGTTAIKVARFSRDRDMICCAARSYHEPGEHELPLERVWQAIVDAAREVVAASAARPVVAGIGLCSQTNSFALVGRDGESLTPVFLWTGNWAQAEADELQERLGGSAIARATGMTSLSGQLLAPKYLHLLRDKRGQKPFGARGPGAAAEERVRPPCSVWLLPDLVTQRLCGQAVSDPSLWSLTGLYDLESRGWWGAMLEACGLRAEQLPSLSAAGLQAGILRDEAASLLGLSPGIPVAVGVLDHLAGAIAAGNTRPGQASVSLGTVACAVVTHLQRPQAIDGGIVGRHPADDQLWYALAWSGLCAGGLNWYARQTGKEDSLPSLIESAAGVERGADGWRAIPRDANDGEAGFHFVRDPDAAGSGEGAGGNVPGDAQAMRAILECLSREIRRLLDRASGGCRIERVTAIGGGAQSTAWLQILTDELGVPVGRLDCTEASVSGAGCMATLAAGMRVSLA